MDTALADSNDHDPTFGISDGTSSIGFQVTLNYAISSPCFNFEGDVTDISLIKRISDQTTSKVNLQHYSGEIIIQIKPND